MLLNSKMFAPDAASSVFVSSAATPRDVRRGTMASNNHLLSFLGVLIPMRCRRGELVG
jgi:hypothetical protein